MKRKLFAILAMVAATGGAAWAADPVVTTPQPTNAFQTSPEVAPPELNPCEPKAEATEDRPITLPPTEPALELEPDRELNITPACSPSPQCFRDRDCWGICGKNNGTCRRVNSCYSECICNVT